MTKEQLEALERWWEGQQVTAGSREGAEHCRNMREVCRLAISGLEQRPESVRMKAWSEMSHAERAAYNKGYADADAALKPQSRSE